MDNSTIAELEHAFEELYRLRNVKIVTAPGAYDGLLPPTVSVHGDYDGSRISVHSARSPIGAAVHDCSRQIVNKLLLYPR